MKNQAYSINKIWYKSLEKSILKGKNLLRFFKFLVSPQLATLSNLEPGSNRQPPSLKSNLLRTILQKLSIVVYQQEMHFYKIIIPVINNRTKQMHFTHKSILR